MDTAQKHLLIPDKVDLEREAIATSWQEKIGSVIRIGKFWKKPELPEAASFAIYGNDTFGHVLAQLLNANLLSPKDDLIAYLSKDWTKRTIQQKTLSNKASLSFPSFIKPIQPKLFKAAVYINSYEFERTTKGLTKDTGILVSEIILIEAEARVFTLNNKVIDLSIYEGQADKKFAFDFAQDFLDNHPNLFPKTFVLDLGFNQQQGWFVLEFNATWGAGLNGCQPENVIAAISVATVVNL